MELIARSHDTGRLLRLWATPDLPAVWDELLHAGIDFISADDLSGLQMHLESRAKCSDSEVGR